ncbi:hypothetical protein RI367_001919 [Sorochytrium milnesiophthora]
MPFCGSSSQGWGPISPTATFDVTPCFAQAVLQTLPSAMLLIVGTMRLRFIRRRPTLYKATPAIRAKIAAYGAMVALSVAHMILSAVSYGDVGSLLLDTVAAVAAMLLATVLSYMEHVKFNIGSSVLTAFWAIKTAAFAIILRTYVNHGVPTSSAMFVLSAMLTAGSVALLLVEGFWKTETPKNQVLEDHASPFVRLFFQWMAPLMRNGSKRYITMGDLRDNHPRFNSEALYADYLAVTKPRASGVQFWTIIASFKRSFLISAFFAAIAVAMTLSVPLLLDRLIAFINSYQQNDTPPQPAIYGYAYAFAMLFTGILQGVATQQGIHMNLRTGMRMQAMLMDVIYRKAMRLSLVGNNTANVGEIVNRMSTDTITLTQGFLFFNDAWTAPLKLILALYFLHFYIGIAGLCGLGVILIATPLLGAAMKVVMREQTTKLTQADMRLRLMSELIAGMKTVKLYATESYFAKRIMSHRDTEQRALRTVYTGFSVVFGVMITLPLLMSVISFWVYALIAPADAPLDTARIFVSLSYFYVMDDPIHSLFDVFQTASRATVSCRRIAEFLDSEEIEPGATVFNRQASKAPIAVLVEKGSFAWSTAGGEQKDSGEQFTLADIDLTFARGTLTAVTGRVGQGKSSLLHALLGEMHRLSGRVEMNGAIAYVAQAAWIINGTVRDNITMGSTYDEKRYRRTLEACSLMPDLAILERGDQTLIGDKGVNLSGGQRARVSLARAVYADADIYLLDDCLSAVDAHVDKHIFTQVIGKNGLLAGKTVILVTHGVHHLPQCDRVVLLRGGAVAEQGTYAELMAQQGDVYALVTEYSTKETDVADESSAPATDDNIHSSQRTLAVDSDEEGTVAPGVFAADVAAQRADDDNTAGAVGWDVYGYYLAAIGPWRLAVFAVLFLAGMGTIISNQLWLVHISHDTDPALHPQPPHSMYYYLAVYASIAGIQLVVSVSSIYWAFVQSAIRASRTLHRRLLERVLRAPSSWFDTTPIGRIINRFSTDIDALDEQLPMMGLNVLFLLQMFLSSSILILCVTPWMVLVMAVAYGVLFFVQRYFLASSREIKRLESGAKAPIFQLFGETVSGITTIRAYQLQDQFIDHLESKIDRFTRANYMTLSARRWLGSTVTIIGAVILFGVSLLSVIMRNTSAGISVGLGVTAAQNLVLYTIFLTRSFCELETTVVSVERVRAYTLVDVEAPEHDAKVDAQWPAAGDIVYRGYSTAYRGGDKMVLKDLNLTIRGGEKIGICGRTGAGKSTITLSLFRIIEAVAGSIEIDGQDISKVGLTDLRSRLTIIPQDPMLFPGTVRDNLDPLGKHSDAEVWRALEHASMKEYITTLEGGLEAKVENGGNNFSAGQKQLLTLAAALLRKQRIVIFDEATSATDAETDAIVQRTIRSEFKDCTVLTIAHRIATIMDSDRILVLDQGQVAEFDTPQALLQNPDSAFAKLVESTANR